MQGSASLDQSSEPLHKISEKAKDAMESSIPELRNKVKAVASETGDRFAEFQEKTKEWTKQNYGKTLGWVSAIAAIGTIGYFIGKNVIKKSNWSEKSDLQ